MWVFLILILKPYFVCMHEFIYLFLLFFFRQRPDFRGAPAASNAAWEILFLARFSMSRYFERIRSLSVSANQKRITFSFFADRFWMVPINEPTVLLGAFLDRFKSACLLEQQLPAMKPEQLKAMVWYFIFNRISINNPTVHHGFSFPQTLAEDIISVLLQLIEDEQVKQGSSPFKVSSDPLSVQVAACILALCGWAAR